MYICKICNNEFDNKRSFSKHLSNKHNISKNKQEEYYNKFYEANKKCLKCNTQLKFKNLWDGYGKLCKKCVTHRDLKTFIILYGKTEGRKRYKNFCNNVGHSHKGLMNENWFIEKYGEKLGRERHQERFNNIHFKNSLKYYIQKYGEDEGKKKFEKRQNSRKEKLSLQCKTEEEIKLINDKKKNTLENFIERHGEELGKKKWDHYKEKRKGQNSLHWFIEKYGEELGREKFKIFQNKSKQTLENFIERYGKSEGRKKYFEYKEKSNFKASKESLKFLKYVYKILRKEYSISKDDIYWGLSGSREWFLNKYAYDFTIKSLKLIIEYNGERYHPNPNWNEEKWNNWYHPFDKNINANDKRLYDEEKIKYAQERGFKIIEIWSSDKNKKKKIKGVLNDTICKD